MALEVVARAAGARSGAGSPTRRSRPRAPPTRARRSGRQRLRRRRLRELPHDPRHAGERRRRARPDAPRRAARRSPRSTIPNTPAELCAAGSPTRRTSSRATRCRTSTSRPRSSRARRLPGEPQLVAIARLRLRGRRAASSASSGCGSARPGLLGWLTTTDHKRIGLLYFWTTLVFFGAGGVEALLMRTQLAAPERARRLAEHLRPAVHDARDHDDLLLHHPDDDGGVRELPAPADDRRARHGVPAHERAQLLDLPRLGDLPLHEPRRSARRRTRAGSTTSRSRARTYDPGRNIDFYCLGIIFNGIASTLTAAHFIVTIFKLPRAGHVAQPDAALLLRVPRRVVRAPVRAAVADRRTRSSSSSTATSARTSSTSRTAGRRSSGSTSSGSSGTPRSTSSSSPRSGSRPRSSPPSRSGAMQSRSRSSRSPSCSSSSSASASGRTTCSRPGCRRSTLVFFAAATAMVVIPSTIQVFAWCMDDGDWAARASGRRCSSSPASSSCS